MASSAIDIAPLMELLSLNTPDSSLEGPLLSHVSAEPRLLPELFNQLAAQVFQYSCFASILLDLFCALY